MREVLPRSRLLSGFIVAIEGLAVWVVAIFLASFRATGWIIWPDADLSTTAVGTMRGWITSGPPGPIELLGFFGLAVAVAGPVWFWMAGPAIDLAERRRTGRRRAEAESASEDDPWSEGDWIPATEAGDESTSGEESKTSELLTSAFESDSTRPDSIQAALANGDFLRGAGRESDDFRAEDTDR